MLHPHYVEACYLIHTHVSFIQLSWLFSLFHLPSCDLLSQIIIAKAMV